jgi:hypothetical protein
VPFGKSLCTFLFTRINGGKYKTPVLTPAGNYAVGYNISAYHSPFQVFHRQKANAQKYSFYLNIFHSASRKGSTGKNALRFEVKRTAF